VQTADHLRKKYKPNDLTQIWFDENDIKIDMSSAQYLHRVLPYEQDVRKIINQYKFQHQSEYQQIVKNYLAPDIVQYRKTLNEYAKKFGYLDVVAPVNVYEE
jgi:predicted amidophosphoribosyltransferase